MHHEPINFLHQPPHPQPPHEPRVQPSKKRSLFFIVLLCIIFFFSGCLATRAFLASQLPQDPTAYDPVTLEPKRPQGFFRKIKNLMVPPKQVLTGEENNRINILLLGQGGPGHDGPYLTDTIMIASVNTETKQVAFTSIPRDLQVNIPNVGYRKINEVNHFGEMKQHNLGPAFTANVLGKIFDIEIPYYIRVDFKAFKEIIDAVGGITVDVDRAFTDAQYPVPGRENAYPISSRYKVLRFKAGEQRMDGQTALEFARSRHGNNGEGSDFARSKRQQKVILALKDEVLSASTVLNPMKMNEILNSLQDNVRTNLQFSDMVTFLKMAREFDTSNIISLNLDSSPTGFLKDGYTSGGAYILTPKAGNFDQINQAIENIFETEGTSPTSTVKAVSQPNIPRPTEEDTGLGLFKPKPRIMRIEVQNATWREGLASRVKKQLEDKELTVHAVGNTVTRPRTNGGIYILTESPTTDTVETLKIDLNLPVFKALPQGEKAATGTDILVILGEDYKE